MTANNSHNICTFCQDDKCQVCNIKNKIHCSMGNKTNIIRFYSNLAALLIISFTTLVVSSIYSGLWWSIPTYLAFWIFYQLVVELSIHCPHCPYFNGEDDKLTCLVNRNISKPRWMKLKYKPGPYNKFEKTIIMVSNLFSFLFPSSILSYSIWQVFFQNSNYIIKDIYIFSSITVLYIIIWSLFSYILIHFYCSKCANFSCPMNMLPKEIFNEYLNKNPYIKKAWEKSGYKID